MSDIGYRKKGDAGPLYNPERDYAYITPTLMVTAIENMDREAVGQEEVTWRQANNITAEDVVKVAEAVADAQRDFVNAADPVHSLTQALARHGFYHLRFPVRQLFFASIGEVFLGAWFKAVREVSCVGEESPASTDMARFAATVREFVRREGGLSYNANHMAEHLKMYSDVLQTRINELYKETQRLATELGAAKKEIASLTAAQPVKPTLIGRISALFKKGS
jgi:hypothetical protein